VLDLIIAGGGPAGLVTALYARRAGLSVAVVEPRATPIDKACGEGLMPAAVTALSDLGVEVVGQPFRGIAYHARGRRAVADFRRAAGLGVRRTDLQSALHRAAVDAGADLVAARVEEVRTGPESVAAGGLRARYLVAADGLHSTVRRRLGLDRPAAGRRWGLRAHFDCAPWTDRVEVHWADGGEAYVTPLGPKRVGVALLGGRTGSFADRVAGFPDLAARLPARPAGPVLGAGPLRQRAAARVAGRVLLVGDAAGYVDALTGEGLAIAFACGRAVVQRLLADRPAGYERDYRAATCRYRLITSSLLAAARQPALRRRIVPAAERLPGTFAAVVDQLAR